MKYFACPILLLLFYASVFPQKAPTAAAVDRYLTQRMEMGSFSGVVLIAENDKIIIRKGYGYADVGRRRPYTPETQHAVASITKMFASMAAILLRDRGKVKLDDPICKYLADCPDAWQPIRIEHLMRHTSGIPDYEGPLELGSARYLAFMLEAGSSRRIMENAKKLPLKFTPGQEFDYSNTGYVILSSVIANASGQSFERFFTNNLLKPAGMKNTGFLSVDRPKRLATGYTHGDLGWAKMLSGFPLTGGDLKELPSMPRSTGHGDASLFSTVDDLLRWSRIMDGKGFVGPGSVKDAFTAGSGGYGFGWFVGKGFDRNRVRHNGMLPGYVSNIDKYIDDGITIIIFSNNDRLRLSNVARDLAAITLGKPYDLPVRGTVIKLSVDQVSKLVGKYKMPDGTVLIVTNEPEHLTAKIEGRYTAGLIPISPTEFYFPLADGRAIFSLGSDGKAEKINMRYSGEDHIGIRIIEMISKGRAAELQ
jgi:CubicO group peptidase (beta-lactamase class C family)